MSLVVCSYSQQLAEAQASVQRAAKSMQGLEAASASPDAYEAAARETLNLLREAANAARLAMSLCGVQAKRVGSVAQGTSDAVLTRCVGIIEEKMDALTAALRKPPSPPPSPPPPPPPPPTPPPPPPEQSKEQAALEEQVLSTIVAPCAGRRKGRRRRLGCWGDCVGVDAAKLALQEAVRLPRLHPRLFAGRGREPWRSVLLYGPPGTGKTLLARAVAEEVAGRGGATFFSVSASDLVSRWLGDSEKLVRVLFETALKKAPSVVFIDEIDAFCTKRGEGDTDTSRRMKTEFLTALGSLLAASASAAGGGDDDDSDVDVDEESASGSSGTGSDGGGASGEDDHDAVGTEGGGVPRVFVLAATNLPWELDTAVLRRFELRLHVSLPDEAGRAALLKKLLHRIDHTLTLPDDALSLAQLTDGFSGSDLQQLVKQANMLPVREALGKMAKCGKGKGDEDEGEDSVEKKDGCDDAVDSERPPLVHLRHLTQLLQEGACGATVDTVTAARYFEYERAGR